MKRMPLVCSALAIVILSAACEREVVDGGAASDPRERSADFTVRVPAARVLFTDLRPADLQRDPVTVRAAAVEGDGLAVTAVFGGGCGEHDFALYMQPAFMESYPVQGALYLQHVNMDDACEALIMREISFDIRPIAELYRDQYGGYDRIILHVYGWFDGPRTHGVTVEYDPR